jgi:hypothetical protein
VSSGMIKKRRNQAKKPPTAAADAGDNY